MIKSKETFMTIYGHAAFKK